MKNNMITWARVTGGTIVLFILLMVFLIVREWKKRDQHQSAIEVLPDLEILGTDNLAFNLSNIEQRFVLIVIFDTECDFCHQQVKELCKLSGDDLKIVLLSRESLGRITSFSNEYHLKELSITAGQLSDDQLSATFGNVGTPYMTLYREKSLVKEFTTLKQGPDIITYLTP